MCTRFIKLHKKADNLVIAINVDNIVCASGSTDGTKIIMDDKSSIDSIMVHESAEKVFEMIENKTSAQ